VGVRPGHALNAELSKVLRKKLLEKKSGATVSKKVLPVESHEKTIDVRGVLNLLPHRYPFVMIDRVVEIVSDDELVALKNVTINEPFFQGHYPGRPVMPGVLQVEAMAQAAGVLLLRKLPADENKIAFFMSVDKVKFRQAVEPGDSIEIRVKLVKIRGNKIATATGECKVGGKLVSSAQLMFMLADATD
jgi:UDP-3-O-[3-hydroxymyristoyl] N-acetylglucosamine deacetylase/3-hydroxyacyl-[acyl-carrier-protein] dehydratase